MEMLLSDNLIIVACVENENMQSIEILRANSNETPFPILKCHCRLALCNGKLHLSRITIIIILLMKPIDVFCTLILRDMAYFFF